MYFQDSTRLSHAVEKMWLFLRLFSGIVLLINITPDTCLDDERKGEIFDHGETNW